MAAAGVAPSETDAARDAEEMYRRERRELKQTQIHTAEFLI